MQARKQNDNLVTLYTTHPYANKPRSEVVAEIDRLRTMLQAYDMDIVKLEGRVNRRDKTIGDLNRDVCRLAREAHKKDFWKSAFWAGTLGLSAFYGFLQVAQHIGMRIR